MSPRLGCQVYHGKACIKLCQWPNLVLKFWIEVDEEEEDTMPLMEDVWWWIFCCCQELSSLLLKTLWPQGPIDEALASRGKLPCGPWPKGALIESFWEVPLIATVEVAGMATNAHYHCFCYYFLTNFGTHQASQELLASMFQAAIPNKFLML